MGVHLPTGIVAFLFSDIEDSTGIAQRFGVDFPGLVTRHFALIREQITGLRGVEVKTTGDGVFAVFPDPASSLIAAGHIQRAIYEEPWPEGGEIRVRIGIHTGQAEVVDGDYIGVDVHRAARVMAAAHGGQVLTTQATRLLAGVEFEYRSLGKHRLRGLDENEEVVQLVVAGLPSDFPPIATATAIPSNLPTRVSSIVGRDREVDELVELLAANRLVTILGPGGVGKTSLAVTVAGRITEQMGGATFVDLSALSDPSLVIPTVAATLNVGEETVDGIVERLGDERTLLIVDNFEQVIEAVAELGKLLQSTVGLRVLATSQVPLRLEGERRYQLLPLATDASMGSSGVEMFFERARAVNPAFSSEVEDVATLVQRLDGLPLAIELVAARANVLTASEMLERLDEGRMSYGTVAGSPDRHRSLDDALRWSYDLLDPEAQLGFRRLGVFVGGMTMATAEHVIGEGGVPDAFLVVSELVDRSLLVRDSGSATRFRMLDGVRRFAVGQLVAGGELEEAQRGFVEHHRGVASGAYRGLQSDRAEWWRALLDTELDNLREVLALLHVAGDVDAGLELLGNTWRFFHSRGHLLELELWLDRFFAPPAARGDGIGFVKGLMARGATRYWQERTTLAVDDYERAVALARSLEDRGVLADALYGLATSLIVDGRHEDSLELMEEAKSLYEELGDTGGVADIVAGDVFVLLNRDGLEGLDDAFAEASELYQSAGRQVQAVQGVFARAAVALAEGRIDDARAFSMEGIRRGRVLSDVFLQTWGLDYLATVELESGNVEKAGLYLGASSKQRERMGGGWGPATVGLPDPRESFVQSLGSERAGQLLESGVGLSVEEAASIALGETPS